MCLPFYGLGPLESAYRAITEVNSSRTFRTLVFCEIGRKVLGQDSHAARVSYVVRRVQNGYLLVGDAFVHGFMYGEALGRRDLRPVDIVLV